MAGAAAGTSSGGMVRASVCLLVCASAVLSTALAPSSDFGLSRFYFTRPLSSFFRRVGVDECRLCYGDDCYTMSEARCEFYIATYDLLDSSQDEKLSSMRGSPDISGQVDTLLMNLVEQASSPPVFRNCIPLISEYTDCSKENACIGCNKCSCDDHGEWNCTAMQHCQAEAPLNVDHHTLVAVMEALRNDYIYQSRLKRFLSTDMPTPTTTARKLTYDELSEWMFENVKTTTTEAVEREAAPANNEVIEVTADTDDTRLNDSDYLVFDDMLNNIGVEVQIYNRRKSLKQHNDTIMDHDYFDDTNVTFHNNNNLDAADQFIQILNAIEDQDSVAVPAPTTTTTTAVVIDLLEIARKKNNAMNTTDFKDISDYGIDLRNATFESTNDVNDFNVMNIIKRDVSKINITELKSSTNGSSIINPSERSDNTSDLYTSNLYKSFCKIIKDKQKELNDLLYVKERMIEFVKGNRSEGGNMQVSERPITSNITNAYFSFYNIGILPKSIEDLRKSDTDKHFVKLRRDILNVIRDILDIQKIIGTRNFPPYLKNLVRDMRHYVHNTENIHTIKKKKKSRQSETFNTRRHWVEPYPVNKDLVKRYLVDILQYIDIDMPQANALAPLSIKSKDVIKRVIKNHYFRDSVRDFRIYDPQYNVTTDLSIVGLKWKQMTIDVLNSLPENKLYSMKLLYLVLMSDITKMTNALEALDFVTSRRLVPVKDRLSEKELKRINNDLKSIHSKINRILEFRTVSKKEPENVNNTLSKPNKKQTLLKHIRNLLKDSKKDIINLLRHKVPKSEIVKELARKKLNELTKSKIIEYKNVMRKWQTNLNVNQRKRRSAFNFEKLKTRINNILPKYLRGKVHSGINNSTKGKNKRKHQKQTLKSHSTHIKDTKQSQTTKVKISTT